MAINNSQDIGGTYFDEFGESQGYVIRNGEFFKVGIPGYDWSWVQSIANNGKLLVMAGSYSSGWNIDNFIVTPDYLFPAVECPVEDIANIEDIEPNDDETWKLTKKLEDSQGNSGYSMLTTETKTAERCLAQKFSENNLTYNRSSSFRTIAYQKHLREIWFRALEHDPKLMTSAQYEACTSRRIKVLYARDEYHVIVREKTSCQAAQEGA